MAEVEVRHLVKRYGTVTAVAGIDLAIERGQFVSILGPSGCGKTTTLRMLAGLIEPTEGSIFIRQQNVTNVPPYRRNLGMVFQDYALFPHMTTAENVAFGMRRRKSPEDQIKKRVAEVLDMVRLGGLQERFPRQLSGGQQQRVALARALAPNPTVLLLDEPLSNLDLKLRQDLRVELKQIQETLGITTIFVTHDQGEALSLSDTVAVMREGRIEQHGAPFELYEQPRNRYIASFLGDANFFSGRWNNGMVRTDDGLELVPNVGHHQPGSQLTLAVRPEKLRIEPEGVNGPNTATGVIETFIYSGSVTRYYVRVGAERQLQVDVPQLDGKVRPPGTDVSLSWDATNCVILEDETA